MTLSNTIEQKLRAVRKAERLTQQALSDMTGISLGTIKNYERGFNSVGLQTVELILSVPQMQKYTLWLMTGKTAPSAGQISPPLSPDGRGSTSDRPKGQKAG
ncbi:helix-turn-helix transcriptional regulator [Citrobacter freundii]|uniref:helix-turn-helix domain-containing protein n=1 Tax=Citrobacter freundii complex TaxID=1344959 RepID=UPI000E0E1A67|nr:helix-turn-helix transcriptional regulator [Citrobacter freundii]EAT6268312.1 helix-turn-helix transcriptional regulator [Salmonella enterica]QLR93298.1 helix-turn-helix transcriptional regulator [Citrobacter freundii]QLS41080.1 helix-turn-helix transcriptional regulator [Citrobacter freundii]